MSIFSDFFNRSDAAILMRLDNLVSRITLMEQKIMGTLNDVANNLHAIGASIDGLSDDIALLNQKIADLQAAAGTPSPELQAAIDAVVAQSGVVADKASALDALTPPKV